MRYLVDTNVFLWYSEGDNRLSQSNKAILFNSQNTVWLSIVSLWEITIKVSRGDLLPDYDLGRYFQSRVLDAGFKILPIQTTHLLTLRTLPFHHKDPFDRLIVAQSLAEKLPLLYTDKIFEHYFAS